MLVYFCLCRPSLLSSRPRPLLFFLRRFGEGWQAAPADDNRPQRMGIWYRGGPEIDAEIVSQFGGDCEALLRGEYDAWQARPLEALAGEHGGAAVVVPSPELAPGGVHALA